MADSSETYSSALFAAWEELAKLAEEEQVIAVRKSQLRQTANALYPLVFPDAIDIKNLSLPDAMRLVIRSTGRALNGAQFETKLEDIGFDLGKYSDPMANILTAMNRMVEAGEMQWVQDAPRKTVEATPELKPIPEAPASVPPELDKSFLDGLAQGLAGKAEGGSK